MEKVRLKYLCSSFSTPITQDEIKEEGIYPVYGASGLVGYKNEYACDQAYLGIIKDGAGVGRIDQYEPQSSLLGTMAYIVPEQGVDISWLKFVIMGMNLGKDTSVTTIPHIYFRDYGNSFVQLINPGEQRKIAAFLDAECARIDAVIEQTRASIEEYKKLKQAVITQAVTKGIRGDRPMKDSGIEWIGEIPEDWRFTKTLNCLVMPITDGLHTTPELYDEGIAFISAEAVSCGNGRIDFSHKRGYISRSFYEECCKKYVPQIDDIYMIKSGATTGRVSMVDTLEPVFTIWSPLAVFRCNKEMMIPRFLFFALQSEGFQLQIAFGWTFGTQQNIGMRTLEQLKVCVPSIEEQAEISEYIDAKCGEVDRLIANKQQLMDDLEIYKKSLIYEYVTGKKEA